MKKLIEKLRLVFAKLFSDVSKPTNILVNSELNNLILQRMKNVEFTMILERIKTLEIVAAKQLEELKLQREIIVYLTTSIEELNNTFDSVNNQEELTMDDDLDEMLSLHPPTQEKTRLN